MVRSWRFRKFVVLFTYTLVTFVSFTTVSDMPLMIKYMLRTTDIVLFIISSIVAYRIHRMYPERHDKPSDFPQLLTTDPYALCRHPFYATLIVNQLSK